MAPPNTDLRIGDRVRRWRHVRALSQEQLAERCNLPSGTSIYRYESNRVVPGVEILTRIAEVLEVPIDALVLEQPRAMPELPDDLLDLLSSLLRETPETRRMAVAAANAVILAKHTKE